MACGNKDVKQSPVERVEVKESNSAEEFQKFIYELFDKNGILNDLRAYLRGHIVNVLKSAQTGNPLLCQKHFTKRLELVSQAFNILIAEYLLQMEFSYSLSVFISEIPLSNMVFDFAKSLYAGMESTYLRFKEDDIWTVLNYLGVQCDSVHALNIVQMYKSDERTPLLFCILKCMPILRTEPIQMHEEIISQDSVTSSTNSLDTLEGKKTKIHRNVSHDQKCRHYALCKLCQSRICRLKEKYKKRKEHVIENVEQSGANSAHDVEDSVTDLSVMERNVIDEMFEQLRSVYEAEVAMVRREEEDRVQRAVAGHALQLRRRQRELEESLSRRAAQLERSAQQKKQLLWGAARALRGSRARLARAAALLARDRRLLADKELELKSQLSDAEASLRRKGEELRVKITNELALLEVHLESVRRERDVLGKQRAELEGRRPGAGPRAGRGASETAGASEQRGMLQQQPAELRLFMESTKVEPRCSVEKSTMTDAAEAPRAAGGGQRGAARAAPRGALLHELNKQISVNLHHSNVDEASRRPSEEIVRASVSPEAAPGAGGARGLQRLAQETLGDCLRRAASLAAARPRSAPAAPRSASPSTSASAFGRRRGAGEQPRGGARRAGPADCGSPPPPARSPPRSPPSACSPPRSPPPAARAPPPARRARPRAPPAGGPESLSSKHSLPQAMYMAEEIKENDQISTSIRGIPRRPAPRAALVGGERSRRKSPRTVLREAKEKLRNNNNVKDRPPAQEREESPNAMLREAKMRLRKLEIEAEAVERSYLDYRKRQMEIKQDRNSISLIRDDLLHKDIAESLDVNISRRFDEDIPAGVSVNFKKDDLMKNDFEKYLLDYKAKFNVGEMIYKNKISILNKVKPIPTAYCEVNTKKYDSNLKNVDYLETPIIEFRKLYHVEKERARYKPKPDASVKSEIANKSNNIKAHEKEDSVNIIENKESKSDLLKKSNLSNEQKSVIAEIPNENNNSRDDNTSQIGPEKIKGVDNELDRMQTISNSVVDDCKLLESEEKAIENIVEEVVAFNRLETLRKIKNNKSAELEILKENINKIYNIQSPDGYNMTTVEEYPDDLALDANLLENLKDKNEDKHHNNEINILQVEVESSCEINKVKMSESLGDEILIVVQSSANTNQFSISDEELNKKSPITVIVSPKDRNKELDERDLDKIETSKSSRSKTPEQAAQLTRNDVMNAIFNVDDDKDISSVDMHLELPNDAVEELNDADKQDDDDYPDDFSADVDNYNSRSEYGNTSPISLPKTYEDENFWDN